VWAQDEETDIDTCHKMEDRLSNRVRRKVMIIKRGNEWLVVHGHPKKKGSKTDQPKGTVIGRHKTKAAAQAQHRAIMASKKNATK
jgi:hypothetical protein